MTKLEKLWLEQSRYNVRIRFKSQHPQDQSYWAKQYILGLVSELSEVLEEVDWKVHRNKLQSDHDIHNLGRELADVTKYVMCLWELYNFTPAQMLQFIEDKNAELEHKFQQEFGTYLAPDVDILISDIDGTLGDWRGAFINFLRKSGRITVPADAGKSMSIETDLGIPYPEYYKLKREFESTGGYKLLEPYMDAVKFIHQAADYGWDIRCYTARPGERYGRIWSDTKQWLDENDIGQFITELHIGGEERISKAYELQELGHRVLMLEDDPTLALRAASTGLHVILRDQPYNVGINHPNILRMDNFTRIDLKGNWPCTTL